MSDSERHRLYLVAMAAFREAREAFGEGPKPGSPEWQRWHTLLDAAAASNNKYLRYVDNHEAPPIPPGR